MASSMLWATPGELCGMVGTQAVYLTQIWGVGGAGVRGDLRRMKHLS